ncbi:hypothetical protein KCP73_10555 [Salmonella enterica subsp. enterica]|nr:hypothetical protein KCP73_10555 [Salmonella enterica subsp. enterica]
MIETPPRCSSRWMMILRALRRLRNARPVTVVAVLYFSHIKTLENRPTASRRIARATMDKPFLSAYRAC